MIPELIFHWAKWTPNKTAIIYNGHSISYAWFAHHIALARGHLVRQGQVGPGCAIIANSNLLSFWVLSLALRSLGFTTAVARGDVAAWLELPDVRCVVTLRAARPSDLDALCAARAVPCVSVSFDGETPLDLDAHKIQHPEGGHILTTSGTTGSYKRILMSPASDAVFLRRKVEAASMNQDTVLSVFHFPPWTAAGYRWAASPWLVGATTLIEEKDKSHRSLFRTDVTHAFMTPGGLPVALAAPVATCPRNETLQLYVGGGPMTRIQMTQAKERITPRLFNLLASTEAGVIAVTPLDTPEDHRWHRLVPERVVEIVDDSGRVLPPGETGRVRISTAGGPIGYLDDETATQTFFKDGFFYPGDLGVIRADGCMALEGRVTDVINRQGGKISPGPLEDRLSEILAVSRICLFSRQNAAGEEECLVVIEAPAPIDAQRLIVAFNRELKEFPRAHVHYVESVPHNVMGKVLREVVRQQAVASDPAISFSYRDPRTGFSVG